MDWLPRLIDRYAGNPLLVCAFGVVLYSDAHPHVKQVIESNDLCRAIHELSGGRWVIFASRAAAGWKASDDGIASMDMLRLTHKGNLSDLWVEPETNARLLATLGLSSTEQLPCLLLLFPDSDGEALTHHIALDDSSRNAAFRSLRSAVISVTEAIEAVAPEHMKNAVGVHSAVGLRLQTERQWAMVKRATPFLKWALSRLGPA